MPRMGKVYAGEHWRLIERWTFSHFHSIWYLCIIFIWIEIACLFCVICAKHLTSLPVQVDNINQRPNEYAPSTKRMDIKLKTVQFLWSFKNQMQMQNVYIWAQKSAFCYSVFWFRAGDDCMTWFRVISLFAWVFFFALQQRALQLQKCAQLTALLFNCRPKISQAVFLLCRSFVPERRPFKQHIWMALVSITFSSSLTQRRLLLLLQFRHE